MINYLFYLFSLSNYRYNTDNYYIDLEEKDLTIPYLEKKMMGSTDILESGSKCGMVVHIVDSDPQPKHEIQLSTLYQTDHSDRTVYYTVELRRRPTPDEENHWKVRNFSKNYVVSFYSKETLRLIVG